MQNITKVPGAIDCVEGVINLRGKVLPVLDLRKRLDLKVAENTEDSRIVIVDIETGQIGVIVDAVTEVLRVENSCIDPPSTMIAHGDADYLKGQAGRPPDNTPGFAQTSFPEGHLRRITADSRRHRAVR